MKKIFYLRVLILFVLAFFIGNSVIAVPVDAPTAKKIAANFLKTELEVANPELQLTPANTDAYYVFNIMPKGGFVIIAADDRVIPLLGYSTTGHFEYAELPPALTDLLNTYEQQVHAAVFKKLPASPEIQQQWYRLSHGQTLNPYKSTVIVSPLLNTTWGQGCYYNTSCPFDTTVPSYCLHTPTGCGATAMGQVMKYWNFPLTGTGSNSYSSNYGTLSANFGATTYDWGNMPVSLSAGNTAVATLLYHCGVATYMTYSPQGSGTYLLKSQNPTQCIENALPVYFRYSPLLRGLERSTYSDVVWLQMVKNDLNLSRPVLYGGRNPSTLAGHIFVLDGYDNADYFHLNWGWYGTYNGYFTLNALNPGTMNFSAYQAAIFGTRPFGTTSACGMQGFNNGLTPPADWTFKSITALYTTAGNYGAASPALRFDGAGDQVVTTDIINPISLSFWLKGIGTTKKSTFKVEGYNGSSWVTIATITNPPTTGTTKTYSNVSTYKAFRFTFSATPGKIAFDDVNVVCGYSSLATLGIQEFSESTDMTVYPNPGTGIFNAEFSGLDQENGTISVYDLQGRLVMIRKLHIGNDLYTIALDLSPCKNGLYTLRFDTGERHLTKRIIKQ